MDHPMLRLYSVNRADMAADTAHELILAGGTASLSMRAVADGMDMTPAGLVHIFGGREQMLVAVANRYAGRWEEWLGRRVGYLGLAGALPEDEQQREGTTVWLAFVSLARSLPAVMDAVAWVDQHERESLRQAIVAGPFSDRLAARRAGRPEPPLNAAPDETTLDLLQAAVHGLRCAITDPRQPLPLDEAQAALGRLLQGLGLGQEGPAPGTGIPSTQVDTA